VSLRRLPPAIAALLAAALPAAASETIVLSGGRVIQAEKAWVEGGELRYLKDGTLFAVPRTLVERVLGQDGAPALVDPDIEKSGKSLAAGDPAEALRLARLALFRQPSSVPALQALAAAQLALGDANRARESAEAALALDASNALSREQLADALSDLADFLDAREQYRKVLALGPQPRVQAKLDALEASALVSSSARFRIRYDGAADEPLGLAVLRVLDAAWVEYERRLGFAPGQPVTVVLQTATGFRDTTRAPEWVAAWNDGTIRVPVMGIQSPTPDLVRVLRHELAHSFVASRAGPKCPTWLHEGIAQWLEGGDPRRDDASLQKLLAARALPRIESLESPFVGLSQSQATTA
jgi:tetratricopeptide (TPR) repeat protein